MESSVPSPQSSVARRVALKIDCDTYVGTRDGVPRLLEVLRARRIRASFFFTFGPDRSGVAARRVFTQPGFLSKMLASGGVSLYGFPTILYGTLLPAPVIGERCAAEMRSVAASGHETGVHGWDHVGWHDALDRWPAEKVRAESGRAHEAYHRVFGAAARSSAAPGWTASAASLEADESRNLLYTSHTRLGGPFRPSAGGRVFRALEIPTTLPTLDETLAWPALRAEEDQRRFFHDAVRGTEVHTIHAEVEGRSKAALFGMILDDWLAAGVAFTTLGELARETLASPDAIPVRELARTTLPGRGGTVATAWPELAGVGAHTDRMPVP